MYFDFAIFICDNYSHTNLEYNKEINIEYRTTTVNFDNYLYIIFVSSKIMKMDSAQQNKTGLYLFNSINCKKVNSKSKF